MKKLTALLFITFSVLTYSIKAQEFTDLSDGEDVEINGLLVSYTTVKKGTKKGADLYRLTATITNRGGDYVRIFDVSPEVFLQKPENAIAYFQFTNATGKAMSATNAHFYPKPKYIKVPYKCKKCPPVAKDEDP